MAFKHLGLEGYRRSIDRDIALAEYFTDLVHGSAELEGWEPQRRPVLAARMRRESAGWAGGPGSARRSSDAGRQGTRSQGGDQLTRKEAVSTQRGAQPIGPYSPAIKAGNLVFVSGQIPINPETGELVSGGIAQQTERTLTNVASLLGAAGSGMDRVVKVGVFLRHMSDFGVMNEVYHRFLPSPHPARTTIQAARLPKDALIEVAVIALCE